MPASDESGGTSASDKSGGISASDESGGTSASDESGGISASDESGDGHVMVEESPLPHQIIASSSSFFSIA